MTITLYKLLGNRHNFCRLRSLTHDVWQQKPAWRKFCRRFDGHLISLHTPQCQHRLNLKPQTPCILHRHRGEDWTVLIAPWDLHDLQNCEQLLSLLYSRLPQYA